MFGSLASKLRYPLLGAAAAALALTTATALAGSGVGDVFNLGQANTVNVESSLSGNTSGGPQLRVENSATTQNAFGVLGRITAGAPGTLSAGSAGSTRARTETASASGASSEQWHRGAG